MLKEKYEQAKELREIELSSWNENWLIDLARFRRGRGGTDKVIYEDSQWRWYFEDARIDECDLMATGYFILDTTLVKWLIIQQMLKEEVNLCLEELAVDIL
jgi:hypothetical protein